MPVGTQGTVKSLTPRQLVEEVGARLILGNTYHLHLRPGDDLIAEFGGLHRFMHWEGPILTDSGGYQVFSLAKRRKISPEGIRFQSHLDGREIFLGPREAMAIQRNLGSDIAMVLDVCPPAEAAEMEVEAAVARTLAWAEVCRQEALAWEHSGHHGQAFAIVQGGRFLDLRQRCAEELVGLDFPGYAVGGVSVGEEECSMLRQVAFTTKLLPREKPRYVMGIGDPVQLLEMIALGADMFDCVMPTREARHGRALTPDGVVSIKQSRYAKDPRPLAENCDNYTCRHFSRAYLRHLFIAEEMLCATLISLHNLHFLTELMKESRRQLQAGTFELWKRAWTTRFRRGELE